jgi:hypothetical protein
MVIQDANIFTQNGTRVWQGKIVLGEKTISLLKYISSVTSRPLYVLRGADGAALGNTAGAADKNFLLKHRAALRVDGENAELVYRGVTGDIVVPL